VLVNFVELPADKNVVSPDARDWVELRTVVKQKVTTAWMTPNPAVEPTPSSVRCAPAFGRGSPRALGFHGRRKVGISPTQGDDHVV
jgi:hypothetical protein